MTCDWLVWDWAWQGTKSKNLRCGLLGPAPEVPAATVHQAWSIEWATRKAEAFNLAARSKHPTHRPQILRDFSQNPFCTRGICPVKSPNTTSTPDIRECCLQVSKAAWVPDTSKRLITKRPLFRWTCAMQVFSRSRPQGPRFGGKSDDYFCSLYEHSFPSRLEREPDSLSLTSHPSAIQFTLNHWIAAKYQNVSTIWTPALHALKGNPKSQQPPSSVLPSSNQVSRQFLRCLCLFWHGWI